MFFPHGRPVLISSSHVNLRFLRKNTSKNAWTKLQSTIKRRFFLTKHISGVSFTENLNRNLRLTLLCVYSHSAYWFLRGPLLSGSTGIH